MLVARVEADYAGEVLEEEIRAVELGAGAHGRAQVGKGQDPADYGVGGFVAYSHALAGEGPEVAFRAGGDPERLPDQKQAAVRVGIFKYIGAAVRPVHAFREGEGEFLHVLAEIVARKGEGQGEVVLDFGRAQRHACDVSGRESPAPQYDGRDVRIMICGVEGYVHDVVLPVCGRRRVYGGAHVALFPERGLRLEADGGHPVRKTGAPVSKVHGYGSGNCLRHSEFYAFHCFSEQVAALGYVESQVMQYMVHTRAEHAAFPLRGGTVHLREGRTRRPAAQAYSGAISGFPVLNRVKHEGQVVVLYRSGQGIADEITVVPFRHRGGYG